MTLCDYGIAEKSLADIMLDFIVFLFQGLLERFIYKIFHYTNKGYELFKEVIPNSDTKKVNLTSLKAFLAYPIH